MVIPVVVQLLAKTQAYATFPLLPGRITTGLIPGIMTKSGTGEGLILENCGIPLK
jgi:hypothetical protein